MEQKTVYLLELCFRFGTAVLSLEIIAVFGVLSLIACLQPKPPITTLPAPKTLRSKTRSLSRLAQLQGMERVTAPCNLRLSPRLRARRASPAQMSRRVFKLTRAQTRIT